MAPVTLPDGSTRDVDLPVQVRRADAVVVTWLVPAALAAEALESGHAPAAAVLEPAIVARGRTMVSMPLVRYHDGDLGTYHETGLAFVVRRRSGPEAAEVASYIAHLPVDGAFTCAAGRQLWGFPKLVADELTIERGPEGGRSHLVTGDGSTVSTLVGPGRVPLPGREVSLTAYAAAEGRVRATPFTMRTSGLRLRPAGTVVRAVGDGPMARDVRALGLDHRRPVSTLWVGSLTGTFAAATDVARTDPADHTAPAAAEPSS